MRSELTEIEGRISALVERLMETTASTLIQAYETKIEALEVEKLILQEKLQKEPHAQQDFEDTFRTAIKFWESPYKLWDTGDYESKVTVIKMAFKDKLPYLRGEGFRTKSNLPIAEPLSFARI